MADSALQVGADVERTMDNMARAMEQSRKLVLREIGQKARADLMASATRVPGGDRRFSRMRGYNHGGLLGVNYRVRDDLVFVGSKGPWKLAETGAAPHRVRGWRHPGTRQGQRSWTSAADPILAAAEQDVPQVIGDAVEEAFGG